MATDVHVGGRLETVAPRPVTDTGDRRRLVALVAVAVVVHAVMVANTTVTARDSIGFARYALELEDPEAGRIMVRGEDGVTPVPADGPRRTQADVLTGSHHPPGYPLAILAASYPVRAVYYAPLPEQMLRSAQVASAVAAVLLVFPTYWLGRMLFGKFAGFVAALLVQVLPAFAEHTSDGETEAVFLLCMSTALALGVWAVRKPGVGGFLLCGLATGATYLVRPEGLVVGAAVAAVVMGVALARRWGPGAGAGWLTALAVGGLLPTVPYMVLIGGITNKPTGQDVIGKLINKFNPRSRLTSEATGAGVGLFADRYQAGSDGPLELWVAKTVVSEATKAIHYVPAALTVVGLLATSRRFRTEPALWVPVVTGLFVLVILAALGYFGSTPRPELGRQHYVSERHTLPLAYVGCLFAAAGLEALPRVLRRLPAVGRWLGSPAVTYVVLAGVVISCVPRLVRPLHDERAGQKEAGQFLATQLDPGDTLIDPYEWAKFFSGRSVRNHPPDLLHPAVAYAVLRAKDLQAVPGSLLPQLDNARNIANDGRARVVFQWPPDAPPDAVKLRVYRLVLKPDAAGGWE